jgi:predicted transcriptional regulator
MGEEYNTLQTIFNIVKNDAHPQTYLCSAREIILRQLNEWDTIQHHLKILTEKGFVIVKQLDKIAICITDSGIEKIKSYSHSSEPMPGFSLNDSKY